uniref:hypothetical protein n=1 Tax=Drechslerella dactyloides TaxID=74499 RepID=UPI0022FD91B6|nr:hypothetical protein PNX16_mgp005 [Drechslerella dactyloides]WAN89846.1 hypothetical protein [Drechslerella dactyloides]
MLGDLRCSAQFYAYCYPVCFNRKISNLIKRTIIFKLFSFNRSRYYSTHSTVNPEGLALEHIKSGKITNHLVINKILSNQKVSITENKLKSLLSIKGIELELPINKNNSKIFDETVGKSSYKGFPGVYIFIHKISNLMYVGSSNLLRRRMEYYFKNDLPQIGKFLPILSKGGLSAFKLKIFKLNIDVFKLQDALFLEQYILLDKACELNTLRVVNFGSQTGKSIYVYDLTCTILYYHAQSQISLKRVLGIHPSSCNKYLNTKIPYLNKFILLSFPVFSAVQSDLTTKELLNIMNNERRVAYELGLRRSVPVVLEVKEGNKFVDLTNLPLSPSIKKVEGNNLEFDSLTSCIVYLKSLGFTIKRDTLSKYIKQGKEFHNFICKYSKKSLPIDFKYLDLLIEEYKNNKLNIKTIEPLNKKK